jgi:hypothetical protein
MRRETGFSMMVTKGGRAPMGRGYISMKTVRLKTAWFSRATRPFLRLLSSSDIHNNNI